MRCPHCDADTPDGAKFCGECGTPLQPRCPQCGADTLPRAKLCGACGTQLTAQSPAPLRYTPGYLAEKILTPRSALEGERKQVTVLFADLKGSMELLADRDPEDARQLLDPMLERMMAAVHQYEGMVNQVMGDGIMALFGAPITHEVAYGNLLQERRRTLHGSIVDALEQLNPDRAEQCERLAHHALRGEVWDKAVDYCRRAGAKAVARSANREAAAYYEQALAALAHQPASLDMRAQAIDLGFDLHIALLPLGDYGRIGDVLREAAACSEALEDQCRLGLISAFMVEHCRRMGEPDRAIPILERGLDLCRVWDIRFWFPLLASPLGYAYALSGPVAEALPLQEQAMEHSMAMGITGGYALYAARLSESYRLTGRLEDASALAEQAVALARAYKERGHEAYALRLLGEQAAASDSPLEAEAYYHQALALADELPMRPLQAHCHRGLGTLYAKIGQREPARAGLSAAIALYRAMEMTFWLPQAEAALAQVEGR